MTNQPIFKCIANLGDATPWDYGGAFVLVDKAGVYTPELRVFEVIEGPPDWWEEHTILLEPCTFVDGILSDNKFHQDYRSWFAKSIPNLASYTSIQEQELISWFCSEDPVKRAEAYRILFDYHGPQDSPVAHRNKMFVMNKMKKWLKEAKHEAT